MALTKIGKEGITGISNSSDATAITIDSSENVGIGTSPNAKLDIKDDSNSTQFILRGRSSDNFGILDFRNNAGDTVKGQVKSDASSNLILRAGSTNDALTIDSSGNAFFGCSTTPSNTIVGFQISPSITTVASHKSSSGTSTVETTHFSFLNGNGVVGAIQTNGTATVFATSSDHRLKENVTADWDATTRLKQLNPVRFNFIADADTTVDGFLAHEVQSVVPEAITGTHNEVDADGNPVYQGIDQSKLVPLLVKTIQELEARITALESE
mgnify:CR=1 FL=1